MGQARFSGKARWAVPAAAVAAAGLVIAGSMLASAAQAAPVLPARSAAQLLADIAGNASAPSSLSGVISETAALGLPQLPNGDGGMPGYSLLAGSHSFSFWYAGPAHVRIAVPVQLGETDLRLDGRQAWLWDSSTDTATRIVLPAHAGPGAVPGLPGSGAVTAVPTPQQAARLILAAVGPTTTVSVQQNVMVAGQSAYQLAIAPKSSGSLVGQIRIAVDSRGYLPLRLQVFARGAASPAYQVGFTSLSFARPAASNFAFTPPPGATVKTVRVPASGAGLLPGLRGSLPPGAGATGTGTVTFSARPGTSSAAGKRDLKMLTRLAQQESKLTRDAGSQNVPWEQRKAVQKTMRAAIKMGLLPGKGGKRVVIAVPAPVTVVPAPGTPVTPGSVASSGWVGGALGVLPGGVLAGLPPGAAPAVIGTGWLSVVTARLDPSSMAGQQPAAVSVGSLPAAVPAGSQSVAVSVGSQSVAVPAGPQSAVLRALLRSATPVHGSWGSGRLLRTSLLSVLFTSQGRVLIGAVTPAVLYGDAAKVK
jgi:outer membrane lipoprotein-sorting protein